VSVFESMKRPGGEGWIGRVEIAREGEDGTFSKKPPASIDDVTDEKRSAIAKSREVLEDGSAGITPVVGPAFLAGGTSPEKTSEKTTNYPFARFAKTMFGIHVGQSFAGRRGLRPVGKN